MSCPDFASGIDAEIRDISFSILQKEQLFHAFVSRLFLRVGVRWRARVRAGPVVLKKKRKEKKRRKKKNVPTHANPADAPTRGRAVRRKPRSAERSALAAALLSCSFDDVTDAAFATSTAHAAPLDDLLEPVAGDPNASRPM